MKKIAVGLSVLCAGLIGPLIFLFQEKRIGLWGFPLDDAWIHLTYARSLSTGQGWSYAGSPPSAGSTSPLWTFLQIPAFSLHAPVILWSYALGVLFLFLNAIVLMQWVRTLEVNARYFGLFFALGEWHLVWASLSGMETLLFCTWVSLMLFLFFPGRIRPEENTTSAGRLLLLGIVSGAGIAIRPEALLLMLFISLAIVLRLYPFLKLRLWPFFLGMTLPVAGYLLFNLAANGLPFPNTFYVKTAEYAGWTSQSIFLRFFQAWVPLLAGPVIALIPFLAAAIFLLARSRKATELLPLAWALSHLLLYAVRLPATYQHGRYFLPVLPVLIGYGVYGYVALKEKVFDRWLPRIAVRVAWTSAFLLTGIFLVIGSAQFSTDVVFIQTNMVDMALWIRENTPAGSVIAAHDIGALGFWGDRHIIDLGGVTDLEALPLLSGTTGLADYLSSRHADYLMTLEGSYAGVLQGCTPGHAAEGYSTLPLQRMLLFEWPPVCSKPR
jgi:hypothetical protein